MTKFKELLNKMKQDLKEQVTSDKSAEEISKLTDTDHNLDLLEEAYSQLEEENSKLKDSYIASVKQTGFKGLGDDDVSGGDKPRSIEEMAAEIVANRKA